MTEKELLYIEDALSHEEFIKSLCDNYATQMQDSSLKEFVSQLSNKNKEIFDRLYSTVNQ